MCAANIPFVVHGPLVLVCVGEASVSVGAEHRKVAVFVDALGGATEGGFEVFGGVAKAVDDDPEGAAVGEVFGGLADDALGDFVLGAQAPVEGGICNDVIKTFAVEGAEHVRTQDAVGGFGGWRWDGGEVVGGGGDGQEAHVAAGEVGLGPALGDVHADDARAAA